MSIPPKMRKNLERGEAPLKHAPTVSTRKKGGRGACPEMEMKPNGECGWEFGEGGDVGEGYPLGDRILRSDC